MGKTDASPESLLRDRVKRLFEFVKRFDERRSPPRRDIAKAEWSLALDDLPRHPSVQVGTGHEDEFVLKIERPNESSCPEPPTILRDWLLSGWREPEREVEHQLTLNRPGGGSADPSASCSERFVEKSERVRALSDWKAKRNAWREAERPVRQVSALFQDVLSLWARLQREGEALRVYVGDAHLVWQQPGDLEGAIRHPLILLELELSFDERKRQLVFAEGGRPPFFYAQAVSTASLPGASKRQCRDIVEKTSDENGCHPLATAPTDSVISQLAAVLDAEVVPAGRELAAPVARPVLQRRPLLFAVPPVSGLQAACDAFLQQIQHLDVLPAAIAQIAGVHTATDSSGLVDGDAPSATAPQDVELYFSKPANAAQEQIARRLASTPTVLVQGPPGTGKTHTIANLIGHFLAEGKKVLVTAQTTKALRVLRDKVTPPLQPLCVSVLDSDLESRAELEHAVHGIIERLSQDQSTFRKRAVDLRGQRKKLQVMVSGLERDLRASLRGEYEELVFGGRTFSPAMAARSVAERAGVDGWLPPPTVGGDFPPASEEEIAELYRLNADLKIEDERTILRGLPDPSRLLTSDQFAELVQLLQKPSPPDPAIQLFRQDTVVPLEDLRSLHLASTRAIAEINDAPPWMLTCAQAGHLGSAHREQWDLLLALIDEVATEAPTLRSQAIENEVEVTAEDIAASLNACAEILAHLERGGGLSWFARLGKQGWGQLLDSATVRGRRPATLDDFRALHAKIRLVDFRDRLRRKWNAIAAPAGLPMPQEAVGEPEDFAVAVAPDIRRGLAWSREQVVPCTTAFEQSGLRFRQLLERTSASPPHAEVRRLVTCLRVAVIPALAFDIDRAERTLLRQRLEEGLSTLPAYPWLPPAANALASLREQDVGGYASALEELWRLWNLKPSVERRAELLAKLASGASGWANVIRSRAQGHGGPLAPGQIQPAWSFRQLDDELRRRDQLQPDALQQSLSTATDQLRETTARLVENLAWAAQVSRTTPEQHSALMSWLQTIRRIGKGTGRKERVQELQRAAQQHLAVAQGCVPVWIMPLSRVFDSFNPGSTHFDVVILDEASQCDLRAMVAMALGDSVLVVGDDEQVTPLDVGKALDAMTALQDEYLSDFNERRTFDGKSSAYELASRAFPGGLVRLTEHFRCVPDIISFSNGLSYKGEIKPLREANSARVLPPTVSHRVAAAERGDERVNRVEALEVASLVAAACQLPEYDKLTIGVVGLLGDYQAREIDTLLQRFIDVGEYKRRRLVCGSPANFQGDERDVMFLSMVYSPKPDGPHPLQDTDDLKRRYNVAASRARDQMWVVHSLDPERDLKPHDVRRRLLDHVLNPRASRTDAQRDRVESDFERRIFNSLTERSFLVKSQVEVGAYRLDLVVEGEKGRVVIECDGDRYHPLEMLDADLARQTVLERLGWRFIRVRGTAYYRDPERELARVVQRLSDAGIAPVSMTPAVVSIQSATVDRVLARAQLIRAKWLEDVSSVNELFEQLMPRGRGRTKLRGLSSET